MTVYGHSGYLRNIFSAHLLKKIVEDVQKLLVKLQGEGTIIDAIAFRGQSGAGVAYPLSALYGWQLVCIRKSITNHGRTVEAAYADINSYIIVDDLISTGSTVYAIKQALPNAECVGVILYDTSGDRYDVGVPVYTI